MAEQGKWNSTDSSGKEDDKTNENVLYFFKGGRRQRLDAIADSHSPSEFLYGLVELRELGMAVELIEQDILPSIRNDIGFLSRFRMMWTTWILRKWCEIAFSGNRYAEALEYLNGFSVIVATPDSIGLALGYLRHNGWLSAKVVVICMATAMKLENNRRKNYLAYWFSRQFVRQAFKGCDRLLALGEGEVSGLQAEFGQLPGLELLPFAVDVSFWRPRKHHLVTKPAVLFVGNDLNRDYKLLVRIAESMPEVQFRFVTGMLTASSVPKNVELINSDWHARSISDEDMREFFQQAVAVIIPLRDTLQPSGQSVCLQAMACGAPVVISRTKGFWEADKFTDKEHCLFIEEPQPEAWVTSIRLLLQDDELCQQLALNARALIEQHYNIVGYAHQIQSHIHDLQHSRVTLES